jgi:hypothetical protein
LAFRDDTGTRRTARQVFQLAAHNWQLAGKNILYKDSLPLLRAACCMLLAASKLFPALHAGKSLLAIRSVVVYDLLD